MSQDVKRFEFEVFQSKNVESKAFDILESCPWMLSVSFWMFLD